MRYKIKIACIMLLLTGCGKQTEKPAPPETDITLVRDITDSFIVQPLADPLLALYDFPHNKDQAALFRLVLLGDKQLNPIEQVQLADGKTTENDNEDEDVNDRENLIRNFYDTARRAIDVFHKQYYPAGGSLQQSECFVTIASELERLARGSEASQKILIVYGDIQENTPDFSCYSHDGRQLLESNPEKVMQKLMHKHPLPQNLSGITVYFVYLPGTRDEDARYCKMIGIYKCLLQARHAKIVVQTTNKSYQP